MIRSAISFTLALVLGVAPCVGQQNTSTSSTPPLTSKEIAAAGALLALMGQMSTPPTYSTMTDRQLSSYVGRVRSMTNSEKGAWGDALMAIAKRADKGDATAADLIAREAQTPSDGSKPYWNDAARYYLIASNGGNLDALYRFGSLLIQERIITLSTTKSHNPTPQEKVASIAQGRAMMRYAISKGYSPISSEISIPIANQQAQSSGADRAEDGSEYSYDVGKPGVQSAPSQQRTSSNSDSSITAGDVAVGAAGAAFFGLLKWAFGGSDDKPNKSERDNNQRNSLNDTLDYNYRSCPVDEQVEVPNPPGSTYASHFETRTKVGHGTECPQ